MIVIDDDAWEELQARCYARGIKDFRACAGGLVMDAIEGGLEPLDEDQWARYEAFKARQGGPDE